MSKDYEDWDRSSTGGYPYNDRGSGKVINVNGAGDGVGGPGGGMGSPMGIKPVGAGAGLGLNNLKQPTQMQPIGGPAKMVGPNPLANGGQGPVSMMPQAGGGGGMMGNGGLPPIGPVSGGVPGGPVVNPVNTGAPIMGHPMGMVTPGPGTLQGGPSMPQRSQGFGGMKPLSSY